MRWLGHIFLFLLVCLFSLALLTPVSFILNQAQSNLPAISAGTAEGSIWDGEISDLHYGKQPVGNVKLKTSWLSVFGGTLESAVSVTDGSVLASGKVGLGLDGSASLKNVRVRGNTADLLSLRQEIRQLGGDFTVQLAHLKVRSGKCLEARGTVWTNILTGFESRYQWKGPEMSGPVSCEHGQVLIKLTGTGDQGERITADLEINLNATGRFHAEIENADNKVAQAATVIGFVTVGEKLVYEHVVKPAT